MTKYLLIVWFGFGQSQTFDATQFDTREACESAKQAVEQVLGAKDGDLTFVVRCVPYEEPRHD